MRSSLPAVSLVLLLLSALPPVLADNDSLKVIVLVDDSPHAVGSPVELTVLVYEGGVPLDPDTTPEVTILSAAPRSVPVFKYDGGLFRGNFTIQPSDVVGDLVPVEASATYGKSSDNDNTYDKDTDIASIYLAPAGSGVLKVALHTLDAPQAVRPGAQVTVAADVTVSGSPAQPDGFNLTASYKDAGGSLRSEPVNATGAGTGRFEGTLALPQVSTDLQLTLTARAYSGNASAESSVRLDFNQFWVVYHNKTKSSTDTTFYLNIADPSGRAVGGATFDFRYWPDGNASHSKAGTAAPTDTGGKSRFSLDFEEGTRTLTLEGWVNASGKAQRFGGTIDVSTGSSAGRPSTGGFEMVYAGPGDLYIPGKPAGRQYVAFNNSLPRRNADIFTYIVASPLSPDGPAPRSPVTLLAARPYITDAQGRVTIPFTPPSYDAYIVFYFKNATGIHPKPSGYFFNHDSNGGEYYSETADIVVSAKRFSGSQVNVQASAYRPGEPAGIKVSTGGSEAGSAQAMWAIGNFDPALPQGAPTDDWQVWAGIAGRLNRTSGGFSGSVTIPIFMPADVKYTAVVLVDAESGALPAYGTAVLLRAVAEEPRTEMFSMELILLIVIVLGSVAAAVGAFAYRRRRSRPAAPAGVPKTIACPACGTSFSIVQGSQPVQIKCPNCGKTGTLPGLPAGQPAAAAAPPEAPAPAAGTRMSVPCPACGTAIEFVRGIGPTRISCPNCGKTGTMAGTAPAQAAAAAPVAAQATPQSAMQAQMVAAAPAGPMMAQAATDMPRPEPVTLTKTIACPQCRNRFTIERTEGPQQIRCPHCGKEGTIGGAPAATVAPAPQPAQPSAAPAPLPVPPTQPAPVPQTMRPAPQPLYRPQVQAGHSPAGLQGQPMRQLPRGVAPGGPPVAPQAAAGKLVTCPACRNRFPVSDPRRPIRIRCPACGKEGTLRT